MKLVDNWRQAGKWYSIHVMWVQAAAVSSWESLPHEWKAVFPAKYMIALAVILGSSGIIGRLIDQSPQDKP